MLDSKREKHTESKWKEIKSKGWRGTEKEKYAESDREIRGKEKCT